MLGKMHRRGAFTIDINPVSQHQRAKPSAHQILYISNTRTQLHALYESFYLSATVHETA